ncbi:Uncharacterised protein [Mycobacteroides abscessus subsp. abscessus]|nr:Uncharacterised protein [Mycobacteroides abscessus subsp. abscessus]
MITTILIVLAVVAVLVIAAWFAAVWLLSELMFGWWNG